MYRYFFAQERKKAYKIPARATFAIAKFPYLIRISQPEILIFFANL